jgi:PKD repeat protein
MKKENINIEDFFRQSFEGHKIEPSENLWKKINFRLNLKQFFKADLSTFNAYYSGLILLAVAGAIVFFSQSDRVKQQSYNEVIVENNSHIHPNFRAENKPTHQIFNEKNDRDSKNINKNIPTKKAAVLSKQIEIPEKSEEIDLKSDKIGKIRKIEISELYDGIDITKILPKKPTPLFALDKREGCAPFELAIENRSEGALSYFWTFGDGGESMDKDPVYTYSNPGTYKIQLMAYGPGGVSYSIVDSIIVHESPSVKVKWPYQSDFNVGDRILIPIESPDAKLFEWNFGDGNFSGKNKADHKYETAGKYLISLKTWTDKNCQDSVLIAEVNVIDPNKQVVFPTAFSPNSDGPSSGRYSERESNIDIFYPKVKGKLAEYKLTIYSRAGIVVFESLDVKIGWDGYYENKLMPQGVYPYVCSGKFEGGGSFTKRGNITILYRK